MLKMWMRVPFYGVCLALFSLLNLSSGKPSDKWNRTNVLPQRNKLGYGGRGEGDINLGPVTDFQCPDGMKIAPHPEYCDLYYTCYVNDAVTLWQCFSDYLFDLEFYGCNYPYLVDCGDRLPPVARTTTTAIITEVPITTTTEKTTITERITTTTEGITTTTEGSTATNEPVRPSPTFTCPYANGFFPVSTESCTQHYYGCIDGTAYQLRCPGETYFDPINFSCAEASAVSCGPDIYSCSQSPNGLYPIPGAYCTNFYYSCQDGKLTEKVCPGTSIFDVTRNLCAPAETVQCYIGQGTTSAASTTNPDGQSTTTTLTTSGANGQTTRTPIPFVCPNPDGTYADPDDCHSYYQCVAGIPFASKCLNPLCYDPTLGLCTTGACSLFC